MMAFEVLAPSNPSQPQAVPIEGAIESLHSAGQYLVLAASDLAGFPEGLNGSLVVLDFAGGPGFGCGAEPAGRGRAKGSSSGGGGAARRGRQTKQQQHAEQQAEQQAEPGGKGGKRKRQQQEGEQQQRQRKGKSKGRGRAAQRGGKAAAAEEEVGPSRKRSRR